MQAVTIEPQKIRRVEKLDQVGRNLNFDRQASKVLFEVHTILSENAQLIQGENPMLMT